MTRDNLEQFFDRELHDCVTTVKGIREGKYKFYKNEHDAREFTLTRCHGAFDFCQQNGIKYGDIVGLYEILFNTLKDDELFEATYTSYV